MEVSLMVIERGRGGTWRRRHEWHCIEILLRLRFSLSSSPHLCFGLIIKDAIILPHLYSSKIFTVLIFPFA
ncbi:hypothetical protein VNO77_40770 [Canavalia gladiata]|uniref:Uncharacterized protein n=1 Tax=Canavalia gladiata TaxID=3824 RepID=A0AAN9PRQ0_CANGL